MKNKIASTSTAGEIPTRRPIKPRAQLNSRQERFVVEYLKDGNGTKAAVRAGYATSSAAVHAHRLLKRATILEAIRGRRERILRRSEVTAEKTLRALADVAFFDPRRLFDRNGNVLPLNKMPYDALCAINLLEVEESVEGGRRIRRLKKVKFANKLPALELLGNHLGIFPTPPKRRR